MSTQTKKSNVPEGKKNKKSGKKKQDYVSIFEDCSSSSDSECEVSARELNREFKKIEKLLHTIETTINQINTTVNTILIVVNQINTTVNTILTVVNEINTTVNTILTVVNEINATVNTILTVVNEINATVNIINTTTMEILAFLQNSCEAKETTIVTIPAGGYVISTPGRYCLQSNQTWTPNANNIGAITITNVEDVDLNLNHYSIIQGNTTSSGNFGVIVTNGSKKITIRNGVLESLSGGGILLSNPVGTVSCGGFINGPSVRDVTIEDIDVAFSGYNGPTLLGGVDGSWAAGILSSGQPGNEIKNIVVRNCTIRDTGLLGNIPQYVTGSITGNTLSLVPTAVFTGSISASVLSVTGVTSGRLFIGQQIFGTGVSVIPPTYITSYETGLGGVGNYGISVSQTASSTSMSTGPYQQIKDNFTVTGTGVSAGTIITEELTPNSYLVNNSQTVASGTVFTISDPTAVFIQNGNIAGVMTSYTKNVVIENIAIQKAWGEFQLYGINIFTSSNVAILKSTIQDLKTFNLCKGIYNNNSNDILIVDNSISGLLMYVTPAITKAGGLGAEGIKIAATSNVIMRKCSFTGLYTKTQIPYTIPVTSPISHIGALGVTTAIGTPQIIIEDCSFEDLFCDNGQVGINSGNAAGFLSFAGNDFHLERCIAKNISGSYGSNAFGYAEETFVGITALQINYVNNTFTNCTATNINLSEASVLSLPVASGFRILGTKDAIIDCTVDLVQDLRTGVFLPSAYGIILDIFLYAPLTFQQATNCTILNNRITNCDTKSMIDNTITKTNIISRTYSYFTGGGSGYSGLPLWIPIRNWLIGSNPNPPVSGSQIDNLDIHN